MALFYEFIGTAILILLGNGVVANVLLNKTKGHNSGLIVITFGWAMAVYIGAIISSEGSGAHLNPAVTIAFALTGKFSWTQVPFYILAQILGAMFGAFLVWVSYRNHYEESNDPELIEATFCTSPAIPHTLNNILTELIGTFVLIFAILYFASAEGAVIGSLNALPVALTVLAIGLSLGGPTGYAINPARDFGPRLMHSILPIAGKSNSSWAYAWIPIVGPVLGAAIAALLFNVLH